MDKCSKCLNDLEPGAIVAIMVRDKVQFCPDCHDKWRVVTQDVLDKALTSFLPRTGVGPGQAATTADMERMKNDQAKMG